MILRVILRDVYPMVIRLIAVPDSLDLTDFDDIFHAMLGWDTGLQEVNERLAKLLQYRRFA